MLWTRAGTGLTVWDDHALRPLVDAGLAVVPYTYVTGGDQYPVEQEVVRGYHTLRGAALVVEARAISEFAGALETYLDSTRDAGLNLYAFTILEVHKYHSSTMAVT